MPDWKREIEGRLEGLRLEPAREAEIVEELSQHLDDRYDEMLAADASSEEAAAAVLRELNESRLLASELGRVEQGDPQPWAAAQAFDHLGMSHLATSTLCRSLS